VLNALIDKPVFGQVDAGSAFVSMLIGGVVLGAVGGVLAARGSSAATA